MQSLLGLLLRPDAFCQPPDNTMSTLTVLFMRPGLIDHVSCCLNNVRIHHLPPVLPIHLLRYHGRDLESVPHQLMRRALGLEAEISSTVNLNYPVIVLPAVMGTIRSI